MVSGAALSMLALVFLLVTAATWLLLSRFGPAMETRVTAYADWIVECSTEMFDPIAQRRARLIILVATGGATVLGLALGGWFFALLFGCVGYLAPWGWMRYRANQRIKRLDDQLVDGFILMANGLRSGLTLMQAIELAADELPPPAADEFGVVLKEIRLGTSIDDGLVAMSERLPLPDLEIAVHSILTLRQSGGNLSETFMTVANTIVDRKKVEGKIQALTAQGLYQGYAVASMPFVFGALLNLMDPEYMQPLFTTAIGWMICAIIVLLDVAGFWLVLKVVKVDV